MFLTLETAVERKKAVQDIDVIGEFEKRVVDTMEGVNVENAGAIFYPLWVMSAFSNFPGASRACADFCDPTAVSRLTHAFKKTTQLKNIVI